MMTHTEVPNPSPDDSRPSSFLDKAKLSRRRFLSAGTAIAATAALQGSKMADVAEAQQPATIVPPRVAIATNNFSQPKVVFPTRDGNTNLGDVHLIMSNFSFCSGTPGEVRSYGGSPPVRPLW